MNPNTNSKDRYQSLMVSASGNFSFTIKTLDQQKCNDRSHGCSSHYRLVFLTKGECKYDLDKRKVVQALTNTLENIKDDVRDEIF
ncbi:MAG: hypothetical protein EOO07_17425 [Chitinophagaceae bacterium]|nr:MAG: hypothetical protein EOO07_17425 [Chitinophagaceae bacterium]